MTPDKRFSRIIEEGRCIACGLCASLFPEKLAMGIDQRSGYLRPLPQDALSDAEVERIYGVCPGVVVTGLPESARGPEDPLDEVWGPYVRLVLAHAADPAVRFRAATGGVLTALADYLISSGRVNAILHVAPGGDDPSFGQPLVSRSREDVIKGSGSRYGPAAPLSVLMDLLDEGEPFAVVAKPCDLSAIRLLGEEDARVGELITHLLAPVCGGILPPFGMKAFLERSGIEPARVKAVSYRGNGCPGPTRVELTDGSAVEKSYLELWGTEASMWHLPWRCKICPDGTAEAADIAAADNWPGGAPTEELMASDPGSNAVILRSAAGAELFASAVEAGFLTEEGPVSLDDLNDWQPHHVRKKIASGARIAGMEEAGQLTLETPGLRTERLRARMDAETDARQREGVKKRLALGKQRDDFGIDT
jgi:coenzyme F420 hydrogenase subunit beta